MAELSQFIQELATYSIAKRGAQQRVVFTEIDLPQSPQVSLPGTTWGEFFAVNYAPKQWFARMPVFKDALGRHRKKYPTIRKSDWAERDEHYYMHVPLDGSVPIDAQKRLIDEAYAIVWNKLDVNARLKIELGEQPYDEPKLMDRLIEVHGLESHRQAIRKLARKAILLRTKKSPESKIAIGATKIGGRPDLPAKTEWPVYRDGKPLAFLAQINLAEINKLGRPLKGLPTDGLLSVFSVWGWIAKDNLDPQTPNDKTFTQQEENGWTVILHTAPHAKLERRKTPRGVNSFKAAAVEPTSILSLPNHRAEPPLAALNFNDEEHERFDQMQSDYRSLQMSHWFGTSDSLASHHLLGGYALFQQQFPEEVLEKRLAMFLQVGSDRNSEMCWGDSGELTFYCDAKALPKGRFERVWGTCQGG